MVKLVVFDMAGTTVDEDNVVYKTVRDAINEKGYSVSLEDVLAAGAGKEKSQAIHDVLDGLGVEPTSETVQVIFRDFQQRLKQAYLDLDVKEQPGASDLFHQLRSNGIKVALNTGYDRDTAENLVAKIGWKTGQHIDTLVTASDVSRGRPHPDMIELAMKHCGVESPALVVKIGDSGIDIEEGKEGWLWFDIWNHHGGPDRGPTRNRQPLAHHPFPQGDGAVCVELARHPFGKPGVELGGE